METSEINLIINGFKNHTLPKEEWTHKNHVLVGSWYLLHHSLEECKGLLREGIKSFNQPTGGQNTDTDGYHETITMFWIYKIHQFILNMQETWRPKT